MLGRHQHAVYAIVSLVPIRHQLTKASNRADVGSFITSRERAIPPDEGVPHLESFLLHVLGAQ